MVDHFSKYAWTKCIIDKKSATVIKALNSYLTTHHNPLMIQSDNGGDSQVENLNSYYWNRI